MTVAAAAAAAAAVGATERKSRGEEAPDRGLLARSSGLYPPTAVRAFTWPWPLNEL